MRKRDTIWGNLLRGLLPTVLMAAVLLFFSAALDSLDSGREEEDQRRLEQALRSSCAVCYAVEGAYPPNLDYLEEHYGVQVDEERYTVVYSVFAANLMPDITVLVHTP